MGTPAPGCQGTVFNILKEGSGPGVAAGANVTVHATGVVKETGKQFWSTKDPGQQPFSYQAGVGQVIKGWDQGLLGMKLGTHSTEEAPSRTLALARAPSPVTPAVSAAARAGAGEQRQVVIPGHEGYGAGGFPAWGIPPNGTLDFTLEVLSIK